MRNDQSLSPSLPFPSLLSLNNATPLAHQCGLTAACVTTAARLGGRKERKGKERKGKERC